MDPEGTLERVRGHTMRVGISLNDPWTREEGGAFGGVEVELIDGFGAEMDAEVEYFEGSEEELFAALLHHELDVVIGGITSQNSHAAEAGMTHPYFTTALVVGWPEDEEVPTDIAGQEVAAERGTEALGLLRKTDAVVVEVDRIEEAPGAAAVDDFLLDDLSLRDTGIRLSETDHVMAVATGENDFMTELERFLLVRHDEIETLLDRDAAGA
ncbi:MAG: transporter substrate-binding domain-containing protein [Actinobacteria bacterium]|nr:transporter substrate-binding domain-containing protein [Actinomycetota bacterium]